MSNLKLVSNNDTRITPSNLEAEQALLGAIFVDNGALERVAAIVKPEHFFEPLHGRIFEVVREMIETGRPATPVSIKSYMDDIDLGGVTSSQYLMRLASFATTAINAPEYAKIIREMAVRRQVITLAQQMLDRAFSANLADSPAQILSDAETQLNEISTEGVEIQAKSTGELAAESLARVKQTMATGKEVGLDCGMALVQELTGQLMPGDLIVVGGGTSHGKAQPLTSLIHTPKGFVTMGSVKVGDQISSVDGQASFVTGVFPQGQKKVYEITFIDGRKVRCCKEHLWKAKFSRWKEERVVSTETLLKIIATKAGRGRLSIPLSAPVECDGYEMPIDPYVIGAMIGDGSLKRTTPQLSTNDPAVLHTVLNAFPALRAAKSGKYDYRISGSGGSNPLRRILDDFGLNCLSPDKSLDWRFFLMPAAQRMALLQGLMDTDGYIDRATGSPVFCTSSEALASDVQRLIWSLGGAAKVTSRIPRYTYRGEKKVGLRAYRVYVRMPRPKDVFRLARRVERASERSRADRDLRLVIKTIEMVGSEECQCISVSHASKLYISNDYTVTHNTALSQQMVFNMARAGNTMLVFSIEMEPEHFNERYLSQEAGVSSESIENAYLNMLEQDRVSDAVERLKEIPLHIVGIQDMTVPMMLAEARRVQRKYGLKCILIDHLQFIEPAQKFRNEAEGIAANVRACKRMAKRLKVPVILISHLNREYAKEDRKPTVSDLYGSGAIEKDADIVLFVHREERALAAREPAPDTKAFTDWWNKMRAAEGKAEVILGKRRRGKGFGKRTLNFDGKTTSFS